MRDRLKHLRTYYAPDIQILEIGPYFNPTFPKAEYRNVTTVDVFDYERLLRNASSDPNIDQRLTARIEPVDFIWQGSLGETLKDRVGEFDLIVSSHNFEHQPDPIRFLLDAERILKDTGILTMAIPTATRCFDAMRPLTTTGTWLEWFERQTKPSYGVLFDNNANFCTASGESLLQHGSFTMDHLKIPSEILKSSFSAEQRYFEEYRDAHCSVLTIESFKVLLFDINKLGILKHLKLIDAVDGDFEFIVHLSKGREAMTFYNDDRRSITLAHLYYYVDELNSLLGRSIINR